MVLFAGLVLGFMYLIPSVLSQDEPYSNPGQAKPDQKPGSGTSPYGDPSFYIRNVVLDPGHIMTVKWDLNDEEQTIDFHIFAKTHGWVGIGISSNGGMKGSDVVIGWISNGKVNFTDRHALGEEKPIIDKEQNYEVLDAYENDTHTVFHIRRKQDTCDPDDMIIQEHGTLKLIYAFGDEDPDEGNDITYHGRQRGSKSLLIVPSVTVHEIPKIPDDTINMDVLADKFPIPEVDTFYLCKIYKIPEFDRRHHIVKVEPVIEKGNEDIVHHLLSYFCYGDDILEEHVGNQEECWTANMPPEWGACSDTGALWNVGGRDFYFPEDVGVSLGGENDPTYIMMEFHYDNPQKDKGRIDSSGLRFVITPTLRKFDAGMINILSRYDGPFWHIPPNEEDFRTFGYCPAECTEEGYKDTADGIHLFANMFHMHLAGRSIVLRHFRNGKELPAVATEDNYDFNLQDFLLLPKHVQVLPGDDLIVECKFDSRAWKTAVKGGFSTQEEMCATTLIFYPRVEFMRAKTFIDIPFTLKHMMDITDVTHNPGVFGPEYVVINSPPELKDMTFDVALADHVDWSDPANGRKYQEVQKWGPIRIICQNKNASFMRFDKLIPPRCEEEYYDDEAANRCPAHPKPRPPKRCVGPNPFPDAETMVAAEESNTSAASAIVLLNPFTILIAQYFLF